MIIITDENIDSIDFNTTTEIIINYNLSKINRCFTNNLTRLICNNINHLNSIPSLPSLTKLNCKWCRNLISIATQPSLVKLNITRCIQLKTLPSLIKLSVETSAISIISGFQNLETLKCSSRNLQKIAYLPNIKSLLCLSCYSLTEIIDIPNLKTLNCDGCTSLIGIINSPNIIELYLITLLY
jgi:hypothetical protein